MRFLKRIQAFPNKKNLGLIIIIFILIFAIILFIVKENRQTDLGEQISSLELSSLEKIDKLPIDLNGDDEKEYVVLVTPDDSSNYLKSIIAYDKSDIIIANLPSEITIKVPMSDSFKVFKLDENDPKEFFSLEFTAGPHQSDTMFFGLSGDKILPVCFKEIPEGPYDCLFYSGNVSYLPIKDLDGDGYVELVEVVDEYPGEGELSEEEEAAFDKVSEEEGDTEFTEGAEEIALREKGGRGRSVVWVIFSYNGKYFVPQDEDNYEKYYSLIGELIKNKMKKSELSKDSLEYIEFVRDFWSHKTN